MQRIIGFWAIALAAILLSAVSPASSQGKTAREWTGKLKDGKMLTRDDLSEILKKHEEWLTDEKKGERAELDSAYLWGVNLSGKNLSRVNLHGADLRKANLRGVSLVEADLNGTKLNDANLSGANLIGAILQEAILIGDTLYAANLSQANLTKANLTRALLDSAILTEAILDSAFLVSAHLKWANLFGTSLIAANLYRADLYCANLTEAKLEGARLFETNLSHSIFELEPGSLPVIPTLTTARNLSRMKFRTSPHSLAELRNAFKQAGLRQQEREITFALKHTDRIKAWEKDFTGKIESAFNLLLFELTCSYGLSPGRPLWMLGLFILFFSLLYSIALKSNRRTIRVTWKGRQRWLRSRPGRKKWILRNIRIAFYFSLLSAFNLGWRDINVGNWFYRLQRRDYTLGATDWVRTVSGIQSLISVYLLTLWVLTYFGRPFE